ncbi:hypothetical protein MtrunA17_Chr1g0203231 [Medicago truncatula]|uniref:Transmembrane protein n=1 Tax=Medicago truncatula TaxID=3880 RepID=A0A396K0X2_MEDTR|nr:hypothetical protein MtrunA17_Chr1g0203231 [Medicago truncatula]
MDGFFSFFNLPFSLFFPMLSPHFFIFSDWRVLAGIALARRLAVEDGTAVVVNVTNKPNVFYYLF